ncbi:MAG: PBP1A family penicillin-binding protein [Acidobacteriaceae bacterium]
MPTPLSAHDRDTPSKRSLLWHAVRRFPFRDPDTPNRHLAARAAVLALLGASAIFGVTLGLVLVYSINLPQMTELEHYRPSTTTELYDIHGQVFGSFAQERRIVVPYSEFPDILREALLSIEDKDFEHNGGINLVRVVEAAYEDVHTHGKVQGASTLTMQLARNLFLSSEKTYGRKLQEIFLALEIERRFTKQQIFTLYANQIYLGGGVYGFEAGAEYYFSKHARDLTLPEAALLAALPKGPESYSPVRFPERALRRRNLVIQEMLNDRKITVQQADAAKATPLGLHLESPPNSEAPYFVEEVRRQLESEYGVDEVHSAGLRVYTTLDLNLQRVANQAVLDGTAAYERRRGWKGHLENILREGQTIDDYKHPDWSQAITNDAYLHALVTSVSPSHITVKLGKVNATLLPADWAWTGVAKASELAQVGDIVYVKIVSGEDTGAPRVSLEQDSGAQAALMAVNNADGEVLAMVGGRDFALSQFNRATQAERQVGSSFKPYVYTAAMEAGMKPYDTVLDAPTTFFTAGGPYSPHDYEKNYRGPMTLVDAFAESRNIPALRLADKVGIKRVIAVARSFGVTSPMPPFLPVAIGAADISLYEQVGAYSVFPNDGIRIAPHFIRRVMQADGEPLQQPRTQVSEVIPVSIAREMMILLEAVVHTGTAASASQLNHPLGGKTGTTNNYTDAWFVGFSPSVTCGTWVGFDSRQSLGDRETGARAALPIWIQFMKAAIANKPNEAFSKANAPKRPIQVPSATDATSPPGPPTSTPVPTSAATPSPASVPQPESQPQSQPQPAHLEPGELRYPIGTAPPPTSEPQSQPAPIVRVPPASPTPARPKLAPKPKAAPVTTPPPSG